MAEDLEEMIVHQLADRRNRSDIVQDICERGGLEWRQAEELVRQVELERAHAVAARQVPMLVFLSACTSAAGILLLVFGIRLLAGLLRGNLVAILYGLANGEAPIAMILIGLSMITGGVIGMHKTMLRYFET